MSSRSRKRANGEGSIIKVGDRYKGAVTMGHNPNGRQVRRYFTARTRSEAQEQLARLVAERRAGTSLEAHRLTVGKYLRHWLAHKRRQVRAKTFAEYEELALGELTHRLGSYRLTHLQALDVERMVTAMLTDGCSPRKTKTALKVLKVALRQAVDWNLIGSSPAQRARPPRLPHREMTVWTPAQAKAFLDVASHHRLYALFYLALDTGMRRGELMALHWEDVDLARGVIRVTRNLVEIGARIEVGEPKTRASRRTIVVAADTVRVLRDHQLSQELELGSRPVMVFASTVGTYVHPRNVARTFANLTSKAGVPVIRLHDLRHTAASLALRSGADLKAVSERLGHSNPSITLNVYYHIFAEQRQRAAVSLTELLATHGAPPS